jgi:hypothetical protein
MAVDVAIVITDAPPLITLATVQSLDYLLYPGLPVVIPDAVFYEATSAADKLGAQEILDWYRAHTDRVRVDPTAIFREEMLLRQALPGRKPARDLGERAAIEVIRTLEMPHHARALLLSDDRDTQRLLVFEPERTILLTTWDYLRQLEAGHRIQSADAVIEAVRRTGRNPPQRDLWSDHDPEIREAVRTVIDRAHRDNPENP